MRLSCLENGRAIRSVGAGRGKRTVDPPKKAVESPKRFTLDLSNVDIASLINPGAGLRSRVPALFPETDLTNRRQKQLLVDRSRRGAGEGSIPLVSPFPDSAKIVLICTDLMGDSDLNPFQPNSLLRTPPLTACPNSYSGQS